MDKTDKLNLLKENLKQLGSLAVAFSGGVDSTFLLHVAADVLGDNVIAVTARSSTYPERESWKRRPLQKKWASPDVIESEELDIEGFSEIQ